MNFALVFRCFSCFRYFLADDYVKYLRVNFFRLLSFPLQSVYIKIKKIELNRKQNLNLSALKRNSLLEWKNSKKISFKCILNNWSFRDYLKK